MLNELTGPDIGQQRALGWEFTCVLPKLLQAWYVYEVRRQAWV